jgi:hypothetical protein
MDKANQESFFCFNCGAKNYFDKAKYSAEKTQNEGEPLRASEEVPIECKSCREINVIRIESNGRE